MIVLKTFDAMGVSAGILISGCGYNEHCEIGLEREC